MLIFFFEEIKELDDLLKKVNKQYEILNAFVDVKCTWGYMILCKDCQKPEIAPKHVNLTMLIKNPPALGKKQKCELCKKVGILC
jgi:hypothetical protein